MIDDQLEKITELLKKLPGIGPRQARRFVFFLLRQNEDYRKELAQKISTLTEEITQCSDCQRFFAGRNKKICNICSNPQANRQFLMIIEKDTDLYNIQQAQVYNGLYFILGGLLPLSNKEDNQLYNFKNLRTRIEREKDLQEIIIALNASTEGDHTAELIKKELSYLKDKIKITTLGRGLSTGTELEYSDPETLKNALKNKSNF